jgi:hypothetical protein
LTDLLNNVEGKNEESKKSEITPEINFQHMQMVNSKRPQTSYGGIQARQKNLKDSMKKNEF